MPTEQPHIVTLKHRETGAYWPRLVMMTDGDRRELLAEIFAGENFDPKIPLTVAGAPDADLPSAFAVGSVVVNVTKCFAQCEACP